MCNLHSKARQIVEFELHGLSSLGLKGFMDKPAIAKSPNVWDGSCHTTVAGPMLGVRSLQQAGGAADTPEAHALPSWG